MRINYTETHFIPKQIINEIASDDEPTTKRRWAWERLLILLSIRKKIALLMRSRHEKNSNYYI